MLKAHYKGPTISKLGDSSRISWLPWPVIAISYSDLQRATIIIMIATRGRNDLRRRELYILLFFFSAQVKTSDGPSARRYFRTVYASDALFVDFRHASSKVPEPYARGISCMASFGGCYRTSSLYKVGDTTRSLRRLIVAERISCTYTASKVRLPCEASGRFLENHFITFCNCL